jgi:hypothetical protein
MKRSGYFCTICNDAARLAVDGVRAIHHLEQALASEGLAVVSPRKVDKVGGVAAGVDDHGAVSSSQALNGAHALSRSSIGKQVNPYMLI